MKFRLFLILFTSLFWEHFDPARASTDLTKIKVPPGYKIGIYADAVEGARSLALGKNGTVFVGTRSEGKVYALVDERHTGKATRIYTIAEGLNEPNGVAFSNGSLYVAEVSRILRFDEIETHLNRPPTFHVIYNQLPQDKHHGWKFIAFGPDGLLYIPVGAPCNNCKQDDPRYASILRMKTDGSKPEIFAEGVRNTVGFDWNPSNRELWFTDNGRDWLGDDAPPDELNVAPRKGMHFGFPYCHGGTLADPEFGKQRKCSEFQKPALNLGAHVAALGMRFWNQQIIIAEHGSWNRSTPTGYRLSSVDVQGRNAKNYQIFAEGWLQGTQVLGRPVDVLPMNSRTLLVSDDKAGVIYKIEK
jgi:glucose/arabinose dehydrogenase